MAHYAVLNSNNEVTEVLTGKDETEIVPDGYASWEEYYSLNFHNGDTVVRCSYNTIDGQHTKGGTPFRGNYPTHGFIYDSENDVFVSPQPFPSWTLNTDKWVYEAPLEKPHPQVYWDEDLYQSDNTQGWVHI